MKTLKIVNLIHIDPPQCGWEGVGVGGGCKFIALNPCRGVAISIFMGNHCTYISTTNKDEKIHSLATSICHANHIAEKMVFITYHDDKAELGQASMIFVHSLAINKEKMYRYTFKIFIFSFLKEICCTLQYRVEGFLRTKIGHITCCAKLWRDF